MAVQPYVAGPSEIYIYDRTSWNFLGYSQSGARVQWIRQYEDFYDDKAGTKNPADVQFMGMEALISVDFTRFSHAALSIARRYVRARAFGAGTLGDIGTLMMYQANDMKLCIRQPFANSSVYGSSVYPNMPEHINFLHVIVVDDSEPMGTKAKVVPMVFRALNYVNPCNGNWEFFDTNPGSLPAAC
jgi:hypothetical protein